MPLAKGKWTAHLPALLENIHDIQKHGRMSTDALFAKVPCAKSVPESDLFMPLGLASSEKQIPQIAENAGKSK